MTRFEPGSVRSGRAVRGDRAPVTGYSRRGTGRSIDDVRGRGREALAATRGATALALPPTVEPARRAARPAPPAREPVRDEPVRAEPAREATTYERIRTSAKRQRVETPQPRPSMTVVPPLPVSAPRAPFVTLVLVVVIVGVLGILVINTKINENAFRLHDMKAQQGNLDQHEQRLEREIAEKASPGNLAAAARQLGLVRADSPAFLRLPDGRSLGVPRPATGPTSAAVPSAQPSDPSAAAGRPGG
jgi:hypothetical protein